MSEKRRSYTEEFKVEAVKLLRESEESAAQIARELGIPQTNLSRWKREMEEDPEGAFPGKGNARDEELARLRRENAKLKKERDILKKSRHLLADAPAVRKYQFMQACASDHSVVMMSRVLGVSRSRYYAWLKRPESQREKNDRRLLTMIKAIHRESRQTYGSPRVHAELRSRGVRCGENRVARLMRENDIQAKQRATFKCTTNSDHDLPVAPNRLDRQFEADGPNRKWTCNITYVSTREGWLYLSVVLDLFSRRVVGHAMKATLESELATEALQMALTRRTLKGPSKKGPSKSSSEVDPLCHSDRGSQYASGDYQALLDQAGITCSMSRRGDCYDNAVTESFFGTLETELTGHRDYQNRSKARTDIFEYIEAFYNRKRRHSALGYLSPAEYEARHSTITGNP
nr:IS3 family transposase [Salinibacter altiplanensis]